jgi:predicted TIM-barrel fold metal-dependent hydrolase
MTCEHNFTRGRLLTQLATIGGGALVASAGMPLESAAQPARKLIDVHHHVLPPDWLTTDGTPDVARVFKGWSVSRALEEMDQAGVATGYASVPIPGARYNSDPAVARSISRSSNEYMASIRDAHPGRFRMWALPPMPNIADSLAEIAYAYDTLKADGIALFTSYGGKYLGNAVFDPVFAELNRRNAVVFVHPTAAPCCTDVQPWIPTAQIEYGTDTTRAIAEYIFNGGTQRFPNVRVIWSHGGGTMPFLVQRFINSGAENLKSRVPNGFLAEAKKCWYDTAQVPSKGAMYALKTVVPSSQILYGTDYPYRAFQWTEDMLTADAVFTPREIAGVYRDNVAAVLAGAGKPVPA